MNKFICLVSASLLSIPLIGFSVTNKTSPTKPVKTIKKATVSSDDDNTPLRSHENIQDKQEQCELRCPYVAPTASGNIGKSQAANDRQNCMNQCLAKP